MTLDAAEESGIRQPAIPATATVKVTATATERVTDGKHWVAGGIASGGGGNGILLWSYSAMGEYNFSDYSKLAQKVLYFFTIHVLGDLSFYVFGRWWGQLLRMYMSKILVKLDRHAFRSAKEAGFRPVEKTEHQGCCVRIPPESGRNRNPALDSAPPQKSRTKTGMCHLDLIKLVKKLVFMTARSGNPDNSLTGIVFELRPRLIS